MKHITRRDLLRTSLAAPAVTAATETILAAEAAQAQTPEPPAPASGGPRERLLLDFGWRFHLGHACDAAQDFGFHGNFSKTGNFGPVGTQTFDDSDWKPVDLPHDWAVELPFQNDPALASKGFYPLGRTYPATSVGWYRRIFELPASDAGQAHHARIRRRLSGSPGGLQRLLHRPPHRRIRSLQLRRHRFRRARSPKRAGGAHGRHPERRLVLRRRRHLPPRVAGEDRRRFT